MWHLEGVKFVQHINEERKPVLCVRLPVWHFAKLHVLINVPQRKITDQVRKMQYDTQTQILIFLSKSSHELLFAMIKNEFLLPAFFPYIFKKPTNVQVKFKCSYCQQNS
jgi:hypothetical protein